MLITIERRASCSMFGRSCEWGITFVRHTGPSIVFDTIELKLLFSSVALYLPIRSISIFGCTCVVLRVVNTRTPGFSLYLERPNGSFLTHAILLVAGKVL